jgi:hypothetical protein
MISTVAAGLALAGEEVVRTAGVLVLVAVSACFYTDGVNVPPVARIDRPLGPYHIDDTVELTASASTDDEPAPLRFDWSAVCASCPEEKGANAKFVVPILGHDTLRVTVVVFDDHGASGSASVDLPVTDRDPDLALQADPGPRGDGTYPVAREIAVSAKGTDPDQDKLTYVADVRPPRASDPNHASFTMRDVTTWTLVPDVPGHWEVVVTASDGFGGKTSMTQALEVGADAPPCIAATSPAALPDARYLVDASDGPRRFAVATVNDDLDPWPAADSKLAFRWFLDGVEVAGHDLADFTIDPVDHLPGDSLALRVEIADRVARTLPCASGQATCSIAGDSCLQRVTWTVDFR